LKPETTNLVNINQKVQLLADLRYILTLVEGNKDLYQEELIVNLAKKAKSLKRLIDKSSKIEGEQK
jgi:hypothetical protein